MSVINYTYREIEDLKKRVTKILEYDQLFKYDQHFKSYNYNEPDTEEKRNEYISRVFWYLFISNQIAYSLQYQTDTTIFEEEEEQEEEQENNEPDTLIRLLKDLRSLNYNLKTNDGNSFICEPYYKFFEKIQAHILELIADIYE